MLLTFYSRGHNRKYLAFIPKFKFESCVIRRSATLDQPNISTEEEFRVLDIRAKKMKPRERKKAPKIPVPPPRCNEMPVDQDWTNVWPATRMFHPAVVPLPIRMGYPRKGHASPGKYANLELMKIPNFLHLTPPAIKKHCEALKQFCSPWPKNLNTENQEKYFPLEVYRTDYVRSDLSIRHPMSRIVTIKVKLSMLSLDEHAKDKMLRLVGDRYDESSDVLTIMTDRCPTRAQNYDYAMYLLTALCHESRKVEKWESEKTLEDMEYYDWDRNVSRKSLLRLLTWTKDAKEESTQPDIDVDGTPVLRQYKKAVSDFMNEGENEFTLQRYKDAVVAVLFPDPQNPHIEVQSETVKN